MTTITSCRGCGAPELEVFLDLGHTPLADALVEEGDLSSAEEVFPLQVGFCSTCSLVQITEDVDPEKLFVDNYLYFSSFSDHLLNHARDHAQSLVASQGLTQDSLVVEIASNDGYLLKNFVEAQIPVIGIDPAPDQAAKANLEGVPTRPEFFTLDYARGLVDEVGRADVIVANNVMAHIPDLNDFVAAMAHLLAEDGVITVENPSVGELIDRVAFDTIYHEHYFYHSCLSVDALMRRHGLHLNDVEEFPDLHGGTNRWWIGHSSAPTARLEAKLAEERDQGLGTLEHYAGFGQRVDELRDNLKGLLRQCRDEGKTIAAYGAAAKGATMLNVVGIDTDLVPYVVDRNPYKQGRYMPGTHQEIRGVEALVEDPPDVLLLLAWNFAEEIMNQQDEFRRNGGQFIIPVPTPTLVS